jgi:hypothetical protein
MLSDQTRALLEDHWGEAERVFANTNIKIGMAHLVDFDSADVKCKTTISFGTRIKDSSENVLHDSDSELPMQIPQKPKRQRKPKTIQTES